MSKDELITNFAWQLGVDPDKVDDDTWQTLYALLTDDREAAVAEALGALGKVRLEVREEQLDAT